MPLRVSGRNISVGPALRERISGRVEEATSKYFRGGYSGHATVGKDGFGFRTECVLHLDRARCWKRKARRPIRMTAPIRPRSTSKNGCGATSAAAKAIRHSEAVEIIQNCIEKRRVATGRSH